MRSSRGEASQDQARASMAGHVRDSAGAGIPGATVCAWDVSLRLACPDVREPTCARTDQAGRYQLEGLPAARYKVAANAPAHRPEAHREGGRDQALALGPGEHRAGVDIVLDRGGVPLRGVVKDISGGVVAGALVAARPGSWWRGHSRSTPARSDADGRFELWVAPGGVSVEAEAEGYASGRASAAAPGQTAEVLLAPEAVLAGRVVQAGQPVAGVRVEANRAADGAGWIGGDRAVTDGEGRFRMARLHPGRYRPIAVSPIGYGEAAESVRLGVGETSHEVVIHLHPAVTVSGRVVGDRPCEDGSVRLHDPRTAEARAADLEAGGAVSMDGVLPGRYEVWVWCAGQVAEDRYPAVEVANQPVTSLVWHVRAGRTIRGRVLDVAGSAVPRAELRAQLVGGDPRGQRVWSDARTGADGRFELTGLVAGRYALEVITDELPELERPVEVEVPIDRDLDGVAITLGEAGTIEGAVTEQGGRAVAGVNVRAIGKQWRRGEDVMTRDDGSFTIRALAPGEYRVTAERGFSDLRAPGSSDDDVQGLPVRVAAGRASRVKLVLERLSGRIAGRVVDAAGRPVADAFVAAERESDAAGSGAGQARAWVRWSSWSRVPVMTGLDGRFTIGRLERGRYTVHALRKGGGEALAEQVATGSNVTLMIHEAGEIRGTVTVARPDGSPPDRFAVTMVDRATAFRRTDTFFRTGGAFRIADLPAGQLELLFEAAEGTASLEIPLERAGKALTCALPSRPRRGSPAGSSRLTGAPRCLACRSSRRGRARRASRSASATWNASKSPMGPAGSRSSGPPRAGSWSSPFRRTGSSPSMTSCAPTSTLGAGSRPSCPRSSWPGSA